MDLRDGEFRLVLSLQSIIFLIIFSLLLLKPAVTSIFLTVYGIKTLPSAFIVIALTAVGTHYLIDYVRKRTSLHKLIKITCLFHVVILLSFGGLFYLGIGVSVFAYLSYIYIAIFALVLATQFWQLCNEAFNLRQAKRVFGPIGSGAIAGGIFGGYTASILVPFIGNSGLFFIASISLLSCYFLYRIVIRSLKSPVEEKFVSSGPTISSSFHIFKFKHVTNLAIVLGIGVLLSKLVDYQFNTVAIEAFPDETKLTAFLGICLSSFNVFSLIVQFFLSSRIVKRFGVVQSMSIFPISIFLFAILFLISPVLIFAVLLKGSDGILKQSVYKSSSELSMMSLPKEIKNEAKNFIDLVIDSLATGLAGILLLSMLTVLSLPVYALTALVVLISVIWLWQLRRLQLSYSSSFKRKITGANGHKQSVDPHDKQSNKLLSKLNDLTITYSISELQNHLSHPTASIRIACVERIDFYDFSDIQHILESHLNDPDDQVLDSIYSVFLKYLEPEQIIIGLLPRFTLRSQAIFYRTLADEISHNYATRGRINLPLRIKSFWELVYQEKHEDRAALKLYLMEAIVKCRIITLYPLITQYLKTPLAPEFTKSAIRASKHGTFKSFGLLLFKLSKDIQYQHLCYEALACYGLRTVQHIENGLLGGYKSYMLGWPHILAMIPLQKSTNTLFKLLKHGRWRLRNEALKSVHEMNSQFPNLDYQRNIVNRGLMLEISNLRKHIESMKSLHSQVGLGNAFDVKRLLRVQNLLIQKSVLQCFTFLGISHNLEDMDMVFRNLSKPDMQKKSIALDFLDDILEYKIKKSFLPMLEVVINKNYTSKPIEDKRANKEQLKSALTHLLYQKNYLVRDKAKSYILESNDSTLLALITDRRFKKFELRNGPALRRVS